MGHSVCLQRWTTVNGSNNTVIQDESEWIHVGAAEDVAVYAEISQAHTGVSTLLHVQTSPTKDESLFAGGITASPYIAEFSTLGMTFGVQPIQIVRFATTSTVAPLSRFVRWSVVFATTNDEITFRIWLNINAGGR